MVIRYAEIYGMLFIHFFNIYALNTYYVPDMTQIVGIQSCMRPDGVLGELVIICGGGGLREVCTYLHLCGTCVPAQWSLFPCHQPRGCPAERSLSWHPHALQHFGSGGNCVFDCKWEQITSSVRTNLNHSQTSIFTLRLAMDWLLHTTQVIGAQPFWCVVALEWSMVSAV